MKQKKETRVTIRLTAEQYESICARAETVHMTPSAYIRAAAMRHKVVVIDGLKEFTHEIAKQFAARAWPESEVLIATHIDAMHIHSHFVVNAVCFTNGRMLRQGPNTLERLRQISDEICQAHGLSVLPTGQKKKRQGMSAREYRSAVKGESWKFRLMNTIDECMRHARTREEFISLMRSEGYDVRWTDTRKSITYTTPTGMKCRDDRLHGDKYLKENMEYEFKIREETVYPWRLHPGAGIWTSRRR